MKSAMAVTGFVSPESLGVLALKSADGTVDVRPERDVDDVYARVRLRDVAEYRTGARGKGGVLVQLILKPRAEVETVVRSPIAGPGMRAIHDPVLDRVRALAAPKMILIG